MIKMEMERFEKCRIYDFKTTFIKYLENHMDHQAQVCFHTAMFLIIIIISNQQLVKYWEAFLPEAKAIAWLEDICNE